MSSVALKTDAAEAMMSSLAEGIERAAWRDAMHVLPAWVLSSSGIHAADVGDALVLASRHSKSLLFNRAIGLGECEAATDEVITQVMDLFWEHGAHHYLIHAGAYAQPMRLGQRLQAQGLRPYRRSWVKLMRGATPMSAPETQVTIRAAQVVDGYCVASIVGSAFDLTQAEAEIIAHLIERPRWRVFIAELDGEVAAVGGMFMGRRVAYLAFAATRPEMRTRGAQRALLHARIQTAIDAGCEYIATETGFPLSADEPSPSYHNLLWAGFRPLSIRDNYAPVGTEWNH